MREIFKPRLDDYELEGNPFRYKGINYQMQNGILTVTGTTRRFCSTLVIPDYFISIDYGEEDDYVVLHHVWNIAPAAFVGAPIKHVKLPRDLRRIGESAFAGCCDLRVVTMGKTDVQIEENAFAGCVNLQTVTGSVGAIVSANAFRACTALSSFTLHIKDMFANAFHGCKNLTEIWLSDNASLHQQALCNSDINVMHVRDKLAFADDVVEHIQRENILLKVLHSASALNHLQGFNVKKVFDVRVIKWFFKSIPGKAHDYLYNYKA